MEIEGFHGTTRTSCAAIEKDKKFKPSAPHHWLGVGVYFFGSNSDFFDGEEDAYFWAKSKSKYEKCEPAVLKAKIEGISNRVFDGFFDKDNRKLLQKIRDKKFNQHRANGLPNEAFVENIIYEALYEMCPFDIIIVMMDGGYAKYFEQSENEMVKYWGPSILRPQIQICVKNCACIKSWENVDLEGYE